MALLTATALSVAVLTATVALATTSDVPPVPPDPVGRYDFPDPAAVFDGTQFHAYGGAMTMASPDLARWGARPDYLLRSPPWARPGSKGGAPSPAVRLADGSWLIYYQADPRDCERPPCGCIGAAQSASAGGPFAPTGEPVVCMPQERGLVDGSARRLAVSGSARHGGKGSDGLTTVLYFKSTGFNTLARPARLWGVVLDATGTRMAQQPVNLVNQTAGWEASGGIGCIEAPAMYVHGGNSTGTGGESPLRAKHTLFYSGGDWTAGLDGLPYSVGYASCDG